MNIAACLLLYSLVVAVAGKPVLTKATRRGSAPRLGIAAWLVAIGTMVGSWVAAAGLLIVEFVRAVGGTERLLQACLALLDTATTSGHQVAVQAALLTPAVLGVAALGRFGWCLGVILHRGRQQTHNHSEATRIVGRRIPGLEAVVLDAPERVAYCVAGRTRTIVVTSAALDALDGSQLAAVLAHERAHLTGHHHLLVALSRALATALPRVGLLTHGAAEVARLLEMRADDAAARTHGRQTVLDALLALAVRPALPAAALGATELGVPARAERLLSPPNTGRVTLARIALLAAVLVLIALPVAISAVTLVGPELCTVAVA